MNVLKTVIVSLFLIKLFAVDIYVPEKFSLNIKNCDVRQYKSIKNVDFNNSVVILTYNEIPLIFEKNLTVITPIGALNEYILTNGKSLSEIKTVINIDFASKILLDKVNGSYKVLKGTFKDFLNKKADAIVCDKDKEINNIYDFPLKKYGIEFNKYFAVVKKDFLKKHFKLIKEINKKLENNLDFRKDLVYKTFVISALYLDKKINFNTLLFENYRLVEEKNERKLIVDVTPNWPPFDIYINRRLRGIGVDFWKLIAKKAKLKYKFKLVKYWNNVLKDIKEKKADLTINTSETPDRKKYALFSKPYVSFPLAIICRNDEEFKSINDIKSIAVGKNFTAEKLMKEHFPNLNYIETKTVFDALKLVTNKKAQCAVDILPVILWSINKNHLMNLQIAFKTPFKFHVQIMIRKDKPDLLVKINKAIDEITPEEKRKIINRYLKTVVVEKENRINKIILLLLITVIVFALLVYIGNKRRVKKIQKLAEYDELTGILNRRGVLSRIKDVKFGSILFLDVDRFKKINDTYGHEFGDFVLSEIGKILKETYRKSDIVGRWGGEEFIVVLPETPYEDALKLAEKLRKIIENHDFKGVKVTISIGVSEYTGDIEDSLKRADKALYDAKNSGRNQVKGKR